MADIAEAGLPIKSPGNTSDKVEIQIVDGVTPTQIATVDSSLDLHVVAKVLDEAGIAFSSANPLPVELSNDPTGTEVQDFNTAAAVAAGGTNNHDLSVANGVTFRFRRAIVSASSRAKWELQLGDGGVSEIFATKAVVFTTEDEPTGVIEFSDVPLVVLGTVNTTTLRIIRTNRDDDDAQDVYSTILGQND